MSSLTTDAHADETLVIETPERVPLHFALASTGNRFLACAFDHAIQFFAIGLLLVVFIYAGDSAMPLYARLKEAPKWVVALLIIALFLVWSGYFVFFEWAWNGQTPGKRRLRLRVIREDGRPVTFWEAAARNLVRILDMMPFPFYSVGLVSVFISRRDQRVGDLVAGTVVVREREAQAPTFAEVFNAPTSDLALRRSFPAVPFAGDLSALSPRDIEVVESFLRRRWDIPDASRQWMAWRVATPVLHKLRPAFDPESFTYEGFLEELLHRYRAVHRFTD
ncbi:MAG TPA: RDD family protein [Pyrinomonadaceae bacterium]|nr:RDD family protein [Pyrinomonadaceae bacterium]